MELILKELDNLKCTKYIKERLNNMLYFSDRIARDVDFNQGNFYIIVPEKVNPQYPNPDYYDFQRGGVIFPFEREEGVTVMEHINETENIVWTSSLEYIQSNMFHAICLEDYNARLDFSYVKNAGRKYYLINNRLFYLLDNSVAIEAINDAFYTVVGYGFMCLILNIQQGLDALNVTHGQELQDVSKERIFQSIDSFYVDVYDDESYLIWVKDAKESKFLEVLSKKILQS